MISNFTLFIISILLSVGIGTLLAIIDILGDEEIGGMK